MDDVYRQLLNSLLSTDKSTYTTTEIVAKSLKDVPLSELLKFTATPDGKVALVIGNTQKFGFEVTTDLTADMAHTLAEDIDKVAQMADLANNKKGTS